MGCFNVEQNGSAHQLLTAGYNVLYADTDINFLKNPLSDLEKICEEGNYDVAFQVAGGASICPSFFYAKSNEKTIHLFNIDREDFKQGYIETFEDGEVKQRKFKEDMMLLNLRLHRAIEPDDINYVQLSANGYPQEFIGNVTSRIVVVNEQNKMRLLFTLIVP